MSIVTDEKTETNEILVQDKSKSYQKLIDSNDSEGFFLLVKNNATFEEILCQTKYYKHPNINILYYKLNNITWNYETKELLIDNVKIILNSKHDKRSFIESYDHKNIKFYINIDNISNSSLQFIIKNNPEVFLNTSYINIQHIDIQKIIVQGPQHTKYHNVIGIVYPNLVQYGNIIISVNNIKSDSIRNYIIKKNPGVFLTAKCIDIEHIDAKKIIIDTKKYSIKYDDISINIYQIESNSIRNYIIDNMDVNEKIKYILLKDNLKKEIDMLYIYNSFEPTNKLNLLKYFFVIEGDKIDRNSALFKIITNKMEQHIFLLELIEQTIITNKIEKAKFLFEQKIINICEYNYKKLINKALELRLFDFNSLFLEYMYIDILKNNNDDNNYDYDKILKKK
jgi:hypothetical protein